MKQPDLGWFDCPVRHGVLYGGLINLGERIRDVRQGPDGALWLLTDSSPGQILRLVPSPQD